MLVKPVKRDDFFTMCDEAPHIDVLPLLKPSSLFAVVCAASEGFTSREQSKDMCCPILAQDVAQCPVCSCPILPQHVAQCHGLCSQRSRCSEDRSSCVSIAGLISIALTSIV